MPYGLTGENDFEHHLEITQKKEDFKHLSVFWLTGKQDKEERQTLSKII